MSPQADYLPAWIRHEHEVMSCLIGMPIWFDVAVTLRRFFRDGADLYLGSSSEPSGSVGPLSRIWYALLGVPVLFAYKAAYWAMVDQWMYRHIIVLRDTDTFDPSSILSKKYKVLAALYTSPLAVILICLWIITLLAIGCVTSLLYPP